MAKSVVLFVVGSSFLFSSAGWSQVTVVPSQPKQGETVRVQVPSASLGPINTDLWVYRANKVRMAGNRITVGIVNAGPGPELPEPPPPVDLPMGQFPEGSYEVEVRVESPTGTVIRTVGMTAFAVQPRNPTDPLWNLTDLWWNPSESGWGFNVIQHPSGVMFATWFVYAADGRATWYVVPNARPIGAGTGFFGAVYRTTGPAFCADNDPCPGLPFDPAAVNVVQVGQASFDFNPFDYERAFMTITIEGKTVSRNVRRQSF